jgi:uncharacterized protein (TIGR02266 family)
MGMEKRASLRIPLSVSVTYRVNGQERKESYRVESVNVGEGGIFLKTDLPLGIGTEIQLDFLLPECDDQCRVNGKVVWSGPIENEALSPVVGKGIQFTEDDEEFKKKLIRYIEKNG